MRMQKYDLHCSKYVPFESPGHSYRGFRVFYVAEVTQRLLQLKNLLPFIWSSGGRLNGAILVSISAEHALGGGFL